MRKDFCSPHISLRSRPGATATHINTAHVFLVGLSLFMAALATTNAQLPFPRLIRNYTPEKWQGQVVQWNRDVQPQNKIDDTIDATDKQLYDVIVNYRRCLEDEDIDFLNSLGPDSKVQMRSKYISSVFVAGLTKDNLKQLADMSDIAFVEEQHEMELHLATSLPAMCVTAGPCSPNTVQEAFPGINGTGVNIAIIDSGVDNATHDTFAGVPFIGGYDATTMTFGDPDDMLFHGTHVASIALGRGGASVARGVANGAGLIDVKLTDTPTFMPTVVCDALEVVYDNRTTWNVGVINMSLGTSVSSDGTDALSQLVDLAESMGIVIVTSAGNNGPGNVGLGTPACASRAITVAAQETQNTAATGDDDIACFSSRGPRANDGDADMLDELKPDIAAPGTHLDASVPTCMLGAGTGILAARWNTASGSVRLEGTSMASPHVAGLAALILQARPGINPASVKDLILSTATPLGPASMPAVSPTWNNQSGFGIVNAFQALSVAAVTDLSFPSYPPSPIWLSPDITTAPYPPHVGTPTTVTVMIENLGPAAAVNARIHFGVHVFSAATPTFFDIGTRVVNLPVGVTPVSIQWVPQNVGHQCLKVEIGYGPDTDYSNNNAQRNITVQSSPAPFIVQNTLTEEPAVIRLVPQMENPNLKWDFAIRPSEVTLGAADCPETVSVELFPPGNALPGQRQVIHVAAVIDTQFGPVTIGGISVEAIKDPMESCLQLICPSNLVVETFSPNGAKVNYPVQVVNQCESSNVTLVCEPPPGSFFPLGRTAVNCMAKDERGVTAQCTFVVEVVQPELKIVREGNDIIISWVGTGILQQADEATGPWEDVPNATNPMVVSPDRARKFYRLRLTPAELPSFSVIGPGVSSSQFDALSNILPIPKEGFNDQGFIQFTDADAFQKIPTMPLGDPGNTDEDEEPLLAEALLFDDISKMTVLPAVQALKTVNEALREARLVSDAGGPYEYMPFTAHSMFQAVDVSGQELVNTPIDTQVGYQLRLGGLPLVGQGAKIKFDFDGAQNITHAVYSLRRVQEGEMMPILPQAEADRLARVKFEALTGQSLPGLQLNSRLVYYAPPAEIGSVQSIYPHFEYTGSFVPKGSETRVQLRRLLLPAVNVAGATPQVDIQADPSGNRIFASAKVSGGTPPYSYEWNSSSTALDPDIVNSQQIDYTVGEGKESPFVEVLTVIVTDANGLSASDSMTFDINPPGASARSGGVSAQAGGVTDVGTEWIGTSQGLSGSAGNAGGFVTRFIIDQIFGGNTSVRFNWGDFNAWERDFKDPSLGGNDTPWIDNVDAAFYTGHANSDGWTFPGNVDDGFLHYTEARYGNNDLEWLVVAACGPLQLGTSPNRWWQRWGPAFDGLHLLCGYQTVTYDNTVEGFKWANYMLAGRTVRSAWMQTGLDVQGASEIVAVMGVFGPNGVSNWNDHYHGKGSVGPDIHDIRGYWMVYSPCD